MGGRLGVGYQTAATVGRWTLTRIQQRPQPVYELVGTLLTTDAFWREQRPVTLDLAMGDRLWTWTGLDPNLTAESLTATLIGAPVIH